MIHTNQIRQWNTTHSLFEWSDQLTAVERYERVGNEIVGEITLYDPVAFLSPLHARLRLTQSQRRPDGLQHLHRHERPVEQHLRAGRTA